MHFEVGRFADKVTMGEPTTTLALTSVSTYVLRREEEDLQGRRDDGALRQRRIHVRHGSTSIRCDSLFRSGKRDDDTRGSSVTAGPIDSYEEGTPSVTWTVPRLASTTG